MVMPRAFSSGAASIWSYALASPPYSLLKTDVSAAVKVVLPWSTCPIVPTLTCGLVRSNLLFATSRDSEELDRTAGSLRKPLYEVSLSAHVAGAHGADRTRDLSLTKGVLYH